MSATSVDVHRYTGLQGDRSHLGTLVFVGMASVMLAVIAYTSVNLAAIVSYTRDIWHHLSVYRELIASPFEAMNPHVATDDPSRSYSPWTVFVALLARAGGLDAFGAIAISATVSALSILVGIFLFTREYVQHRWAPALFLVIFLGAWFDYVNHTGYHTVATFLFAMSYPFAIVLGMGFVLWWLVLRAQAATGAKLAVFLVILTALSAALFITHQLQGLFAVAAACGFALFAGKPTLGRRALITVSLLAGLYLSQYWWYFDPVAYILNSEVRSGHDAPRQFDLKPHDLPQILQTLGFALFGLAGLINAKTDKLRFELALPTLVLVAGFGYLLMKESWVNTRVLPFVMLYLQMGLLMYLLGPAKEGQASKPNQLVRFGLTAALVCSFAYATTTGYAAYNKARVLLTTDSFIVKYPTWSADIAGAARFAEGLAPAGSTVIAHRDTAFPIQSTALAVVAIPRLFAQVPDMLQRQADNRAFFDGTTSLEQRCEILQRYDVQMIAYRDAWLPEEVRADLQVFGTRQTYDEMSFLPATDGRFAVCTQ